jgi:trigger factor
MIFSMQVTETLSDGLKRGFTITVPETEITGKREKRLAELSKTMQLPGFRPGKVPMSMVRKRYGDAVAAEIIEGAVNEASDQLLAERNLRPAMQPKLEVTKPGQNSDLEFTLQLEILPDITIPALTDIKLNKPVAEVSEQAITEALDRLAKQRQSFEPVETPRPAEAGEQLIVDFVGKVDGEAFQGGTANDVPVIVAGEGFVPGFAEQLVGLSPGETRTINVTFPKDYAKPLAGKDATFEITAKSLNIPNVPAADDEFAKQLGLDSLEALRQDISERISKEYAQLSRMKQKRALLDALAERAQFTAPESLVEGEFAEIWRQVEQEKAADRRVRLGLLVAEIGRANEISVTDQDLQRAMFAEAMRYRDQAMQVLDFFKKNPQAMDRFRGPIFEDKVVDYLLGQVQLEEVTVTPEELAADPES